MSVYRDERRKKDQWVVDFRHKKERYFKGFKTKKAALAWEKAKKEALKADPLIALGSVVAAGSPKYMEVAEEVLDRWKDHDQDAEWIRTKNYVLLGGPFGEWKDAPVSLITREVLEKRLGEIKKDVSAEAANRYLRILRAMFNVAVNKGLVNANPTAGVEFFPRMDQPPMGYVPSKAEVDRVVLKAKPLDQSYILIMYHSLARPFEIQRLKWVHMDLQTGFLTLWTRKRDKSRSWTPRQIPMHPKLREAILRVKNEVGTEQEHVFVHKRTGGPYRRRPKALRTLCKDAKVRRFQWRGLRKSAATRMLDEGVPLPTISELLGHTSLETTRRYLGIDKQRLRDAVEVLSK